MKTQNSVSQKIWILIKSIKNKDILNRNVMLLKSMFISMHSILGWASFCMNYCINAAWHGGNLWHCSGVMEDQVSFGAFPLHGTVRFVSLLGGFPLGTVPGTFLVPRQPRFQAIRTVTKTWRVNTADHSLAGENRHYCVTELATRDPT